MQITLSVPLTKVTIEKTAKENLNKWNLSTSLKTVMKERQILKRNINNFFKNHYR